MKRRALTKLIALTPLFLLSSCAKFPDTPPIDNSVRLLFTLDVQSQLNTGQNQGSSGLPYVYVIALNLSTDDVPTTTGPIPVVIPSGNGIVAGEATHFILWNPLTSPQYQIYKFQDTALNDYFQTGIPITYRTVDLQTPGNRLEFEIDLSQLVAPAEVPNIKSVQVNFLTMNNTNTAGGGRLWDALGDANIPTQINAPFTVRTNTAFTYTNANQSNLEPPNDTPDPALDITNWSREVRP